MGDCHKEYMAFQDQEDELRSEYETESASWIDLGQENDVAISGEVNRETDRVVSETERIRGGRRLVRRWHDMFRAPGTPRGMFGGSSHKVPEHLSTVDIPYKELHATFEEFVANHHGFTERDPEKQRYGHWENPNKKWDWWVVGGRWNGSIPIRDGVDAVRGEAGVMGALASDPRKTDACRIDQIDRDALSLESAKELAEAWDRWIAYRCSLVGEAPEGVGIDVFDIRRQALSLGLIECISCEEATEGRVRGRATKRWEAHGMARVDVISDITEQAFKQQMRDHFCSIRTFAYLDSSGWHEAGEMGWWGISSDTPDTKAAYARTFIEWFSSGDPRDWLVVVDCHI